MKLWKKFFFRVSLVSICKDNPGFDHCVSLYFIKTFVYTEHLSVSKTYLELETNNKIKS